MEFPQQKGGVREPPRGSRAYQDFRDAEGGDNVDLTIGKGEIDALLGENGAGKSTLVKMLFGSLEPYSGEIGWNGEAVNISSPSVGQEARHRHGVPAFLPVRGVFGGRKHRAVARRRHPDQHDCREGAGALLQLRPAARSLFDGRRPFGRRTPAHRDDPLPAADAGSRHPGRADVGAHAAGGRPAFRDAQAAALGGQRSSISPPARGGEAALRQGHRHAPWQGRRPLRPAPGDGCFARPHDGRERGPDGCAGADEA